jgi:hypothetical protein
MDMWRERNADWPEPFAVGEFYDYTVAEIDRGGMIETCGSREDAPSRMMICTRTGF